MKLKYTFILLFLIAPWTLGKTVAQSNGSNSSYSRFGLGLLSDQANSYNRSMGGVGQALRSNSRINFLNPASYSAVDSLTFLFDVGMSLQRTRMVQDNAHVGVSNTSFDFVTAAFRMRRHLGMTLGFKPYTRIGYSFSHEENVGLDYSTGEQITSPSEYDGEGGLHEAFIGVGWEPFKGFSFGANVGVLWGNIKHSILTAYSQNSVLSTTDGNITTLYDASIVTWRGDVGVQYQTVLNSMNRLTFGATVGIGHKINNDASYISSTNASTADTLVAAKGFQLPMTYSFGLAWEHAERLLLAADVHYEQWGKCTTPEFTSTPGRMRLPLEPTKTVCASTWVLSTSRVAMSVPSGNVSTIVLVLSFQRLTCASTERTDLRSSACRRVWASPLPTVGRT